jgi:hypothetical protein
VFVRKSHAARYGASGSRSVERTGKSPFICGMLKLISLTGVIATLNKAQRRTSTVHVIFSTFKYRALFPTTMKKLFFLLAIASLTAATGFAQKNGGTYNWSVGAKYLPKSMSEFEPMGITVKHYTKAGDALELIFSKYTEGYRGTVLFELSPALDATSKHLRLLLGPGFHIGALKDKFKDRHDTNPVVGFDAIVGLEYKIPKIPIALQVDYQPSADLVGNNEAFGSWGGATVRIAF